MASEVHSYGTLAQVTAAVNGMTPSNHPGMAALLARVQGYVANELASFPGRPGYSVYVTCHHDAIISSITIRVYPANVSSGGQAATANATQNDAEPF